VRFEVSTAVLLKIQVDLDANAVFAGRRIVVLSFSVSGSLNFLGPLSVPIFELTWRNITEAWTL